MRKQRRIGEVKEVRYARYLAIVLIDSFVIDIIYYKLNELQYKIK